MANPEDIQAVGFNRASRCECSHHPLEHEMAAALLTGGPAPCSKCDCKDLKMAKGSPGPLQIYDGAGKEIVVNEDHKGCCRCGVLKNPDLSDVTWVCAGCNRLVCRVCTMTVPGSQPPMYYHDTLCSPACHEKVGRPEE